MNTEHKTYLSHTYSTNKPTCIARICLPSHFSPAVTFPQAPPKCRNHSLHDSVSVQLWSTLHLQLPRGQSCSQIAAAAVVAPVAAAVASVVVVAAAVASVVAAAAVVASVVAVVASVVVAVAVVEFAGQAPAAAAADVATTVEQG